MDLTELRTKGWTLIRGITSQEDLLELGKLIGTPVQAPNGELVKQIRRTDAEKAPSGSQSSIYGTGSFPLHTDTVFLPLPVRYVLLRGYGDTRRPTTVKSFPKLLQECDLKIQKLARNSVWLVRAGNNRFYCSMYFKEGSTIGWRYDVDIMSPVNQAAVEVHKVFRSLVDTENVDHIDWTDDTAAILSNWTTLHGRGPEPKDEGERIIERLYVR